LVAPSMLQEVLQLLRRLHHRRRDKPQEFDRLTGDD
jgi:hypothetical protein